MNAVTGNLPARSARGPLATDEQLEREALGLWLWRSAPVRAAVEQVAGTYLADARARSEGGRGSARAAAESIGFAAVQHVLVSDPRRPALLWSANAAHRWFGLDVPGSGYGIDNPDNVHRRAAIEGASRYLLRGRVPANGPAQQSIIAYVGPEAGGEVTREGTGIAGVLLSDRLDVAADGTFEVTLDTTPADGRPNHLQISPDSTWMLVRDVLADWSTQVPTEVELVRVAGPEPGPERDEGALAELAAGTLMRLGRYWLDYNNQLIYSREPHRLREPAPRPFGRSCAGWFALGEGESLLVGIDPLGAAYVGFDVTDPWGVTRPYVDATGSLNNHQARANPDGTLSFVVGPEDPGVHNWVDTSGLAEGMLAVRWQGGELAEDRAAVREVTVVPTSSVRRLLPDDQRVDAEERAALLRRRTEDYGRRLGPLG